MKKNFSFIAFALFASAMTFSFSACGDDDDNAGETATPSSGLDNSHEWVDLGLPSKNKWATCNIGADKPEAYGNYFAWGESLITHGVHISTAQLLINSLSTATSPLRERMVTQMLPTPILVEY